ncbi:MAG: proline dehydrogenase family protein [Candidatus Limnocylindrales bacterium]
MARNERLAETIPNLRFAQRAVRRFMPGERVEDAFAAAERLRDERVGVLFTRLGENISAIDEARAVTQHYREVLATDARRAHAAGPVEISVKPTQLGLDQDPEECRRLCAELAEAAAEAGSWFWIDMEGSDYTDRTLDLAEAVMADHDNVGIAIQAYLYRSAADIARLLPLKPAIRLVKGAYDEPASVAYRGSSEVDASFLGLALMVAEAAAAGNARLALGTHDVELIGQIRTITAAQGIPPATLEVHMLYGIREQELRRLRDAGHPAYSLVAYGEAWYRWYMRRLAERPANVVFALRQLLP